MDVKPTAIARNDGVPAGDIVSYHPSGWPYSIAMSNTTAQSPNLYDTTYGYEQVVGCAHGLPNEPLFYGAFDEASLVTVPGQSFCDSIDSLDPCEFSC